MLAKKEMKSGTEVFPGGNTIDVETSVSMCRFLACCLSSEAIREAAELGIRALPLSKWNQWVVDWIPKVRWKK